jgi:hypothetical protein
MKPAAGLLAAIAALSVTSGVFGAQQSAGPCPGMYPEPKVGEYAELRLTSPQQGSMSVRLAVVGEQRVEGRAHFWIEVVSVLPPDGDTVTVQMLVPTYPFEQRDIRSYIVKQPGQPALKLPREMIQQLEAAGPGPSWREQCAAADDLGNERVSVPAGTFIARRYRTPGQKGDIWIADVPFGMVRTVTADGEMELIRYGSDARSSISEKPIEVRPPGR